jgi:hypothetical protein
MDCVETIVGMCDLLEFNDLLLADAAAQPFSRLDGRYAVASAARKRDGKRI